MLRHLGALVVAWVTWAHCGGASALDPRVQAMGDSFVADLSPDWRTTRGDWRVFDVAACFASGAHCFASNPSGPYGFLVLDGTSKFNLDEGEAVVVFMRTPPELQYFGFTQYLNTRGAEKQTLIASLGDTLNQLKFSSLDSGEPGTGVFDAYAVLVWTADLNAFAVVEDALIRQGIDPSRINPVWIPVGLPLHMGYGPADDTFTLVMRVALPTSQERLDAYLDERPLYVVKVTPNAAAPIAPAPMTGFAEEISGVWEDAALESALASLVGDIVKNYRGAFRLRASPVRSVSKDRTGWDCIALNIFCSFDNHDATYWADTPTPVVVKNVDDVVIVAGVNHRSTGKAIYTSHAVQSVPQNTGIVDIGGDRLSKESALYHAGVRSPRDPRVRLYEQLYAYAIAFDCGSYSYCLQIPPPTPENPVGLDPGEPFVVLGRYYVEPRTGVRPDLSEVIGHRVLIGTRTK